METVVSASRIATLNAWTSERRRNNARIVQDRWLMAGLGVPDVTDWKFPTHFTRLQLWPSLNNAETALVINQDQNNICIDIDVESTTVDVMNVDAVTTTGIGFDYNFDSMTTGSLFDGSLNALTSGKGITVATTSTALTTGELLDLDATISGTILSNRTGALTDIAISRTEARTSGTTADDFDVLSLHRTTISNHAGATVTSAGSLLKIQNTVTQTLGSLTDTVNGVEIVMDVDGSGYGVDIDSNSVTASAIRVVSDMTTATGGVLTATANAATTGSAVSLTSSSTVIAAGQLVNVALTSSGASITAKTGSLAAVTASRTDTRTSGTTADDYDLFSLTRTNIMNGTGGTLTATGAVLRVENVATQTLGTLTDSVKGIELVMDVDGTGAGLDIDSNNVTATAINVVSDMTTATGGVLKATANAATTGSALSLTSSSAVIAAGELANIALTSSGIALVNKTGSLVAIASSRTEARTSGTTADDFDVVSLARTSVSNDAGATMTSTGSVLRLENVATQTLGTLTDTVKGLEIVMDVDGTGAGIDIDSNNIAATAINVVSDMTTATGGVLAGAANAITTGTALSLTSTSAAIAAGTLANIALTTNGSSIVNKTGSLVAIASSRTENRAAGTTADDYDALSIIRTSVNVTGGGTLTAAGSVLRVENVATQTAGTLTDTTAGIELVMGAVGSGKGLFIDYNHATGLAVDIDPETTTGTSVQISADVLTTGTPLYVVSNSADTGVAAIAHFKNDHATAVSHTPLLCTQDALSGAITSGLSAIFRNTQGGAIGSVIKIQHNPGNSAAADADVTGRILFTADDEEAGATERAVGQIDCVWVDATAASYDSKLNFYTSTSAAQNLAAYINGVGELGVDLSSGAGTATVFDDVEGGDVDLLAMWNPDPLEREAFLHRLEGLGIVHRKDTGSGWMLKVQKSIFLTWGAINELGRVFTALQDRISVLTEQVTSLQRALPA